MSDKQYWAKALRLEEQDRIDEAIDVLRTEMGNLAGYWQAQVSFLFETRAKRLWKRGDRDGAREAAKSAVDWVWRYAGNASSGSEGLMLSGQAREVEKRLRRYLKD